MANSITDARNSFITFNEQLFLTQRECAIVKPFCLPVFNASDIAFQFILNSTDSLSDINSRLRIRTKALDGIFTFVTGFTKEVVELSTGVYVVVIVLQDSTLIDPYAVGECFQINFGLSFEGEIFYNKTAVQCFQVVADTCFTSKLSYYNIEDAFGFIYGDIALKFNRIRLPIYFKNPQPQNDQKVYVRSSGTRQKLYARLAKKWFGLIDMTTEEVHQKLVVALSHDFVTFETDNGYNLECTFEDEYNQDFPDNVMQGINVWTANFSVMETPFDEVNNNCG
jgi:hypothetical protein